MTNMLTEFFNAFVKATGWLPQKIAFRTKIEYEDKAVQGRHIKGPAIIICNHTSVFDYAVLLFVFFTRTLRVQMAEVLFQKKPLGLFLKMMGGIYVNRDTHDFSFMGKSEELLRKGKVAGIFPESRLPLKNEERPLPFKPSAAYIALAADVPVIPVYTNGSYFNLKKRAHVIIGTPMNVHDFADDARSEKENIDRLTNAMRERIIRLGRMLDDTADEKK